MSASPPKSDHKSDHKSRHGDGCVGYIALQGGSKASATFAFVTEYAPGHAVDIEPVSGRILRNSGIIETVAGEFRALAASKKESCNSEPAIELKKRGRGGRLRGDGLRIGRT